jgi:NADH-quinone oxidoreductase subunit M
MGVVTIGIFTPNALGLDGAIFLMLSHGVVSGALFMGVGVLYDRLHTHEIARFGGIVERMPIYAAVFMLFALAGIGLPGTSGFVGEILVIVGVFEVNSWVALLATTGAFLGAAYMLWMYRRVIFGAMVKDELKSFKDLRPNEIVAFVPLIVIVLLMGIYPSLFLEPMEASVEHLLTQVGAPAAADLAAR